MQKESVRAVDVIRKLLTLPFYTAEGRIGLKTVSLERQRKIFIWAGNFKIDPRLTGIERRRSALADFIVRIKLMDNSDAVWGQAVNFKKSDPKAGKVEFDTKPGCYGLYVEKTKLKWFNDRLPLIEPITFSELDPHHRLMYNELFDKAYRLVSRNVK